RTLVAAKVWVSPYPDSLVIIHTRRSSGIRAAWHFWYAVGFGGKGGLLKVGLGGTHPLTQRYVHKMDCRYG
ncbi:hypothetical protein M2G66_21715, partial [Vibrio vulnificus]|nr:hypothetical protein [Vibrio vulnificus]